MIMRNKRQRKRQIKLMPIQNSANPKVSVVIPVMNERRTIAQVIREARNVHPDTEVIVVINGSTDGSHQIARRMGAKIIWFQEQLGNDVGRAIGAMEAKGDIILFTDGDIVIPTRQLIPFVDGVSQGLDIALNSYQGETNKMVVHQVVLSKTVLNTVLPNAADLNGSSLTCIPHALSRKAITEIGAANLAVPPLAQTIAISKGLLIQKVTHIGVGRLNVRRKKEISQMVKRLIIGDHLEAIHWWLTQMGHERGHFTDLGRDRQRVREL